MVPHSQSSSLQRLHGVEKLIVRVLELAGAVMEELGNSQGPRSDAVANHCREFMTAIKGWAWERRRSRAAYMRNIYIYIYIYMKVPINPQ